MSDYHDYEKVERLNRLKNRLELQKALPHLYGQKLYPWQREFLEARERMLLLTAANQIGKSTINIKKILTLITSPNLWPVWWPVLHKLGQIPRQFWYLYPDLKVATTEWDEKWVPEFMPRAEMKKHPVFGWQEYKKDKLIQSVTFNSGPTIYFKGYSQNPQSLQSGTVAYIGCDEELPFHLVDELVNRLEHTAGYFSLVFTATLNQIEWAQAIEPEYRGTDLEKFKDAKKMQINLYMCQRYEDGSPSMWTPERIEARKNRCSSKSEILRRVMGRFISSKNKKFVFSMIKNTMPPRKVPNDWLIYSGTDIGTGGPDNHPAAFVFVAVSPDFTEGEVFLGRRLDDVITTSGDILEHYLKMREPFKHKVVMQRYDGHARDFFLVASGVGETFIPANKSHADGEDVISTLFKYEALRIHLPDKSYEPTTENEEYVYELQKLVNELAQLLRDTDKRKAKDDFTDALRYCVVGIPWDIDKIKVKKVQKPIELPTNLELRRARAMGSDKESDIEIEQEIAEWNELMGVK